MRYVEDGLCLGGRHGHPRERPENPRELTIAIGALGRRREWKQAVECLTEAQGQTLEIGLICYNAGINVCGKNRQWRCAVETLADVQLLSLEPDPISYNAANAACMVDTRWSRTTEMLVEMEDQRQCSNRRPSRKRPLVLGFQVAGKNAPVRLAG